MSYRQFSRIRSQFCVVDGVLCCKYTPGPLEEEQTVPGVPLSLQPTALKATHDIISSGHQGVEKTLQRLKCTAYWFGMAKGHRAMLQELYGVPKVQAANANTDSNDQYSNWTPLADAGC